MRQASGKARSWAHRYAWESAWVAVPVAGMIWAAGSIGDLPTTREDFFTPGTRPLTLNAAMDSANVCSFCHGGYDAAHEPYRLWAGTMMAQSARDPVFHAAIAIAEQDAPGSGDTCMKCHVPVGWLEGRANPDFSELQPVDWEGVNCITCHRMVDHVYVPGQSPAVDQGIIAALTDPPVSRHNGAYVIDPEDRRRGPFDIPPQAEWHEWLRSPFHQSSNMCATCHDVSNPAFSRTPAGTYALNPLNQRHPTQQKLDMFPEQRTYSEWAASAFAQAPINMGGRFGGNKLEVSSCQDCHMADATAHGCEPFLGGPLRPDLPTHGFNGANNWVLRAVDKLYSRDDTRLTDEIIEDAIERNEAFLRLASDMELTSRGARLTVRIINQTGHKLPTGYPEGRRMWINVEFFDRAGVRIAEFGAYDASTAVLDAAGTKVYEGVIGVDETIAGAAGVPVGPGFHLAINNVWYKDNRIPPRGFTNAGFEAVQAAPVAYSYADGQHWDDTTYAIPPGAVRARARLYYQISTREYMEFLRDTALNGAGQIAYAEWERYDKSPPVLMDDMQISVCTADVDGDGFVDFFDFDAFVADFESGTGVADFNGDGFVDFFDYDDFVVAFETGC